MLNRGMNKRGQVSIFVIIAVTILAVIALILILREVLVKSEIPEQFQPIEEQYLACIEEQTLAGISILEQKGGYIYSPEFISGSEYSPTSNQLNFFGSGIPFWYYITGNNLVKSQVPTESDMEKQLEKYLNENLNCNFDNFISQGFIIDLGNVDADVDIKDKEVSVSINSDLDAYLDGESVRISEHEKSVGSYLGKFYKTALDVYNFEQTDTFLEKYALDVLYLYAPMTGTELSCSPKVWVVDDIKKDVKNALEANTMMIKTKGDYYQTDKQGEYFVVNDLATDEGVRFLYSKDWATKLDVEDESGLLIAKPVGNQQGMGIMGFCYVSYHFVYDLIYPVLIQVYDEEEIFQFPVNVIIKGNKERKPAEGSVIEGAETQVCRYPMSDFSVYTYDSNLNPIEAEISFKCFNENCYIGKTQLSGGDAYLVNKVPQCVNGFIIARAEGYQEQKKMVSTNSEISVNIILDKLYDINVNLKLDNKDSGKSALVYFESEDYSAVLSYPEQKIVKLAEGEYNITAFVYDNKDIFIPAANNQKCVDVPQSGVLGILGVTDEQCFDLTVPAQTVSNVIVGGGKSSQYLTETELEKGNMDIEVESVEIPKSLEDLQNNYNLIETKPVYLNFV